MQNSNKKSNLGLYLGVLGALAGIFLITQGDYLIGISGGIASAGLAYINYKAKKG